MHGKPHNTKLNLGAATPAAERLSKSMGVEIPAERLRRAMIHSGASSMVTRYAAGAEKSPEDLSRIEATLLVHGSKQPYRGASYASVGDKPVKPKKDRKDKIARKDNKVSSIPAHAVRLSVPSGPLDEGCGCEEADKKTKLMDKIKKKYLKETPSKWSVKSKNLNNLTQVVNDFTKLNLHEFVGKKVMLETDTGVYRGTLVLIKENCGIADDEGQIHKVFDQTDVLKLFHGDQRIVVSEGKNVAQDKEAWSDCKSQAKKKFDVYPSAYANAWASKCYKKKGGTWKKLDESIISLEEKILHHGDEWIVTDSSGEKTLGTHPTRGKAVKQLQAIEASKARKKNISEGAKLLLKEKLASIFFKEEIVNPENEFTMTDDEIFERDQYADAMLNDPKFNPTLQNNDTKEEAAFRIATHKIIGQRSGGSTKGKGYERGVFDNLEGSRKKRRAGRDMIKGDKTESDRRKTETITDKRGRKVTRKKVKSGQKGVIKPQFKAAAAKLRKQRKAVPAEYYRKTANLTGAAGQRRSDFAKSRRANEERRAK